MAEEKKNPQGGNAPAPAPLKPTDDQLKAAVSKAAADAKKPLTSNRACLLATLRILRDYYNLPKAECQRALTDWKGKGGHGLGCNASQLGQWVKGDSATAEGAEDELMA